MGRGTARSAVEGHAVTDGPSTMLRMVPLPIRFADREDMKASPFAAARAIRRRHCTGAGRAKGKMTCKFFGTDGIRGRTNKMPMTAEMALKIGQAAGAHFLRGDHRHRVVIGKDTRLSGYMIEYAMVAGFTSVGMDVLLLGPMPTPAVTPRVLRLLSFSTLRCMMSSNE